MVLEKEGKRRGRGTFRKWLGIIGTSYNDLTDPAYERYPEKGFVTEAFQKARGF